MSSDCNMFIGLDYHNQSVQVCGLDGQGGQQFNRRCRNNWQAIVASVGASVPVQAAIEATPGAADLAEELVEYAGWSVHLAHARYVAKLKQSPDKTDFSDAKLLADLTRVGYLPRVWLAPHGVRELRRLVNHRRQLADRIRALKLRLGALLRDHRVSIEGRSWTKGWCRRLAEQMPTLPGETSWIIGEHLAELAEQARRLKSAEQRLHQVTADDAVTQRLLALRGVGLVTATALRAAIGRFDRFRNGKALARYCGLSPRNASSGMRQSDGGLISEANKPLRALLIELAWRLIRYVPRWRAMTMRMRRRGKAGSLIAAAVANRWVRNLHHVMKEPTMA